MPGTTPVYGFPYPEPTDLVADYPALGQQLAEDVEDALIASAPGSGNADVATNQTTTSTSYTNLATAGPSVTLTTGTKALVIVAANVYGSPQGATTYMSVAVSGASTVAASDTWSASADSPVANFAITSARAWLFTGLTAGSNTFTAKYRTTSGTAGFTRRSITVVNMGS